MSGPDRLAAHDEAAIGWMVELGSGTAGPQQRQAFARWLAADPHHRLAWQRLGGAVDQTLGRPPVGSGSLLDSAMQRSSALSVRRRRMLRGALGVAGTVVAGAWAGRQGGWVPDMGADLHTGIGQRRSFALDDGSRLLLDARSSADALVSTAQRHVNLRQGQLIASVHGSGLPFSVASTAGQVQGQGGQLLLRREGARSFALAMEQDWQISTHAGHWGLRQGQAAWFDAQGLQRADSAAGARAATAWSRGTLEALDMALGTVVDALRAYRSGLLVITDDAARLRVTGTYPLDDTDAALQALAETLPVAVRHRGASMLVHISLRA